jgi:hypothetical protein
VSRFTPWLTLLALGAFHGLNPAMGWLFAVGRGLQDGERKSVLQALPPIAAGHAASIAAVALLAGVAGFLIDLRTVQIVAGAVLIAFALVVLSRKIRHKWFGMRVGLPALVGWSFLMSTAHGAGLMLVPVMLAIPSIRLVCTLGPAHASLAAASTATPLWQGLGAVALHTAAMLAVAMTLALLVFHKLGLRLLRTHWINLDLVWAGALAVAGVVTLVLAL